MGLHCDLRKAAHVLILYNDAPKGLESHAKLVADLPRPLNSPLTHKGPGKMPVGDVRDTLLSVLIWFKRQICLRSVAGPEWARFTMEHKLCCTEIIAA